MKTYFKILKWEVPFHLPYSPDITPSDYHLLHSMHMAWLSSTSILMEMQINKINKELILDSFKVCVVFLLWNSNAARKIG